MFRIGMGELVVLFLIILLLFGAKRLPEIGKSLAKALKEFRKASKGLEDEDLDDQPKE